MKGVVITGGSAPPPDTVRLWSEEAQCIIAADSGLATAVACGLKPDRVVGDFDSLPSPSLLDGIDESRIERHPRDKDFTDTELALSAARAEGCDEVVIIGGGGGRMDHLIGILSLFDRDPAPVAWVTDRSVLQNVTQQIEITGETGNVVSFFPLGCSPCRARSHGLRWPLDGLTWKRGDIGVSNELVGNSARVQIVSGRLLLVRELEG